MALRKFKVGLVQTLVSSDKRLNILKAVSKVEEAATSGADVVILPVEATSKIKLEKHPSPSCVYKECFACPYGNQYFQQYCEPFDGDSVKSLVEAAKQYKVHIIGGSFPEADDQKLFNTCPVINREGRVVAKHRKIHLFDINVPGKMVFKESDMLTAGERPTIIETEFCKIGIGICYDARFSELARLYTKAGCGMLVYPGAFNMTTGPAHWELLARSRAVDSQCFVAFCSPARDPNASYVAWGHSLVVDPWGTVIASADEHETIIYADIDLDQLDNVRNMIPISVQRRTDVYETISQLPLTVSK